MKTTDQLLADIQKLGYKVGQLGYKDEAELTKIISLIAIGTSPVKILNYITLRFIMMPKATLFTLLH